jgi:hypothetical protein
MAEYRVTVNYDSLDSGYVQVDFDLTINGANLQGGVTPQDVAEAVANAVSDAIETEVTNSGATFLSRSAKRYYSAVQSIVLS